jgi:metal-sulfur cluster biosynthetic enzyme
MPECEALSAREREVRARLDLVCDPELDEPITEMGFVEAVAIAGDRVEVASGCRPTGAARTSPS